MVSCCAGAELQVRGVGLPPGDARGRQPDIKILLRELYPMKSDLYERARELEAKYRVGGSDPSRTLEGDEEASRS
jgi:hypothetical protein